MITKSNIKDLAILLGFKENGYRMVKTFNQYHATMEIDFSKEKLIYPREIVGRERNDSFDKPENFVVFECVNRLLEKGYRPEHIELEKEWHLGHNAKSGRADICVYNEEKTEMLCIIECKTAGKEYNKALKDTMTDGAQLFSYWQQEHSTKWLCLYSSDLEDKTIKIQQITINCSDDENIAFLAKKDKSIKLYNTTNTAPEKYLVWKETYNCQTLGDLIFSEDTIAYKIGIKPLLKKDLRDFTPEDKIVNKFEEILRHNNVSDKENAFNRLIALFICKLVDEIGKTDNDEVEFQYKQGTDTYESLQDRLQRLHKQGMDEFMKEKIFYVENDYAEKLFMQYTGVKRKRAIEELNNTIRILKFYTNNDFAFKDVHNEELFYQNGKILVEVVQLFENYRIVYPSKHQFLGDLFEQLLNKGFKQNEGQFFTPTPITRFIWDSLPLEKIIHNKDKYNLPRVIDYACGAGHFLTEGIEAINAYFEHIDNSSIIKNNTWVEKNVYGIEKDYRLARVSKVSMFMNGAGGSNIIFGDGLENYPEKSIEKNSFDILVANPPYSVSSFKNHLKLKNNEFELLDYISNSGSEIETLFVERIAQLVKPNGISAVVLPSSILSNNSNSYIGAREQLLKYFLIRAIVCFGSKTFGATGTNTVVLFLEKRDEPPVREKIVEDSANAILLNKNIIEWEDREIKNGYLKQIEVNEETYNILIDEKEDIDKLKDVEYFKGYFTDFEKLKKKTSVRQYIKNKEFEKIKYFALVYNQTTLVITAPSDNTKQKEFLGYDWSNRKGSEGIVINKFGGMLFDEYNRYNDNTLSGAIRNSFKDNLLELEDKNEYYSYYTLKDLIDFSRTEFDKSIKTNISVKRNINSKFDLEELKNICEIVRGVSYSKEEQSIGATNVKVLTADNISIDGKFEINKIIYVKDSTSFDSVKQLKKDDIFICMSSGSKNHVGKVAYIENDTDYYAGGFMGILRAKETILSRYLYYILNDSNIKSLIKYDSNGSNIQNLSNSLGYIKIPVPPIEIQQKIIDECQKIDNEYNSTRMSIETYKNKIQQLFNDLDVISQGGGESLDS